MPYTSHIIYILSLLQSFKTDLLILGQRVGWVYTRSSLYRKDYIKVPIRYNGTGLENMRQISGQDVSYGWQVVNKPPVIPEHYYLGQATSMWRFLFYPKQRVSLL